MTPIQPQDCKKFTNCNAAICPLDLSEGYHRSEDKVCPFALATAKEGADEHYKDTPEYWAVKERVPELIQLCPNIGQRIEKAAETGIKKCNFKKNAA